jgi:hypothetical protein
MITGRALSLAFHFIAAMIKNRKMRRRKELNIPL